MNKNDARNLCRIRRRKNWSNIGCRANILTNREEVYSMQSSRILLLAKTFVMVYTLGNDQAADMLQNSIILLLVLELISKEDADEVLQDISEGKKQESTEFHFKLSREEVDDTVQELRKLAEKCTVEKASSSLLETAEFIDDFWQEY